RSGRCGRRGRRAHLVRRRRAPGRRRDGVDGAPQGRGTLVDVITHITNSESETAAIGRALAGTFSAGDVVLLEGDLGAGKTAFVRGLAEGLGVAPDDVSSPTFTLMQEYRGGRVPLIHVDLYRLNDPREI